MLRIFSLSLLWTVSSHFGFAEDQKAANRLTYLYGPVDPYYVGTDFAKLTTPQWIGEPGVTTAAILSIDDMYEPAKYEAFLRPILDRLKEIEGAEGQAPLSIFTCEVDPTDPQLQVWLKEGVSIEVHTVLHPCPALEEGDFAAAKETIDKCIDLLKGIPNMSPVCYRMPCCDSMNSLSPRFFAEIFNQKTPRGSFLQSDSSTFVWFNEKDKSLPAEIVAGDRFAPYMPRLRGWVNYIENYPYPYVIGTKCWEFPSVIPTDWEAQNRHGVNLEKTVDDLKAALDACVVKEGLFSFLFHPHGWIENSQIVDLVGYADKTHGGKVRFLNVREATERITKNMLLGQGLRKTDGSDNGVRVLDLNNDGYMDVIIGNETMRKTRLWNPEKSEWNEFPFPGRLDDIGAAGGIARFAPDNRSGYATVRLHGDSARWLFTGSSQGWRKMTEEPDGFYRDVDGDGNIELITSEAVYFASQQVDGASVDTLNDSETGAWKKHEISPPPPGARFVDLDGDNDLDYVFSDGDRFEVRLFESPEKGWSIRGRSGKRGEQDPAEEIPPIIRADGSNNGAWIRGNRFFWQNEDTVIPKSQVHQRSFNFLQEAGAE